MSDRLPRLKSFLRFVAARKESYELALSLPMIKMHASIYSLLDVGSKRAVGRIGNELGDFTLGLVAG